MKLEEPTNKNYCATVVNLPAVRFSLNGLDKLEGVSVFGFNVIVSKGTEGLGIFFPAETQLSDKYCYYNNLFRHGDKNENPDEKGYLEDNRRVRAIKFKGNTSTGFFMPLDSLLWAGVDIKLLKEGDEFDTLNGNEICKKYMVARKENSRQQQADRGFVRADKKFMPEHIDTENFFKNHDKIDPSIEVIVTQKLHGTSIRIAHTMVNHKPTLIDRIAKFFGAKIIDTEYAYLYGSRKVIKDANNPNQNHYYSEDIWTNEGKKLDGILPKNYIVYAELIGWTADGKEIQRDYTYGLPQGTCEMYIYRIAIVNDQGLMTDLSWEQVKEFCTKNGLKYVPELFKCTMEALTMNDFKEIKKLLDVRYFEGDHRNCIYLGDNQLVDEGVCVRADGLTPKLLKAKSPLFLEHETQELDKGVEDLESSQSVV